IPSLALRACVEVPRWGDTHLLLLSLSPCRQPTAISCVRIAQGDPSLTRLWPATVRKQPGRSRTGPTRAAFQAAQSRNSLLNGRSAKVDTYLARFLPSKPYQLTFGSGAILSANRPMAAATSLALALFLTRRTSANVAPGFRPGGT